MLLWILSDIHVELTRGWDLPGPGERPDFDVLVVAGDLIPRAERGVGWLCERVTDRPVIYVAGNHEFYGADIDRTVEKARAAAEGTNVFVLQDETVEIDGVVFAGATLWTDFDLYGDRDRTLFVVGERMNDFRSGSPTTRGASPPSRRWRATRRPAPSWRRSSGGPAAARWWW